MRNLIAGLGLLGLLTLAACSYTVQLPPDESSRVSPSVTVSPASQAPGMASSTEGSMPAGHGMEGMPPMMSPHGGMPPTMSPSGGQQPEVGPPPSRTIAIGTGLKLEAPKDWVPKVPSVSMIQNEFSVPAAEGDPADGRVTVMSAGGSVQENIDRWLGQFAPPDGSSPEKAADKGKVEKLELAGCEVHMVDVSGTYSDARGMMAPAVQRPDYRMLAAIVVTPEGNYFVKFYGPKKTVGQQAEAFRTMIQSLGK